MGDLDQENTVLHCRKGMAISGINLWISPIPHDLHSRSHILFHCHQLCSIDLWCVRKKSECFQIWMLEVEHKPESVKLTDIWPVQASKSSKRHYQTHYNDYFPCIMSGGTHAVLFVVLIFQQVWWRFAPHKVGVLYNQDKQILQLHNTENAVNVVMNILTLLPIKLRLNLRDRFGWQLWVMANLVSEKFNGWVRKK